MSKWIKRVLGLAAVGSAAAGLYFYLKKSSSDTTDDDMKPVGDREYVPLNTPAKESGEAKMDSEPEEDSKEEAPREESGSEDKEDA